MKIYEMTFGDSGQDGRDYFFSPNNIFNITRFQRPYTWEEYQIRGVIQDIEYVLDTGNAVGWPSMLVQESQLGNMNVNNYDLGDGQQRSTTVFLFLAAIWHKWKVDFRETDQTEEYEFFNNIFYVGKDRNKGILGRKTYGEITTRIEFQTPSATNKIHALFETELMSEEALKNLTDSVRAQDSAYQLYNSFLVIWRRLQEASYTEVELKGIAEILLTKIVFPVMVYSKDENMFRAFANINSFGEPLKQSELVKAEIYGRVKAVDSKLADEIADYWNNVMDVWFAKHNTSIGFDYFLTQEFNIFDNWRFVSAKNTSDYIARKNQRDRWLKTEWQKYFDKASANLKEDPYELKLFYEKTFAKIKEHFKIAQLIVENKQFKPSTKEWEIQYTNNIIAGLHMGIIFQLHDEMNEKDFILTMRLLRKYCLYNNIVLKDKNTHQLITHNDSPMRIKRTDLKFEDFEKYFMNKITNKGGWLDYSETARILSVREYDNKYNPILSKLFIYINNEKMVAAGHEQEQKNTAYALNCSREHIIPQTNKDKEKYSVDEIEYYNRKISKLGNLLIITGSENGTVKNNPVKDKIGIYKNSQNTAWGNYWIDDFLSDYSKDSNAWNDSKKYYQAIDDRSKKLANVIAGHLCAPNTEKVEIGDNTEPIKLLTIEDHKGNRASSTKIRQVFIDYLQELTKLPEVRNTFIENSKSKSCFYYSHTVEPDIKNISLLSDNLYIKDSFLSRNEMMKIINEINSSLLEYNTTLTVEYGDSDDSRTDLPSQPKINHKISDSLGNTIEAKNSRRIYIEWVKELAKNSEIKQEFYKMLSEGLSFFKKEEFIDIRNSKWTEKLDDGLYLMINIGSEEANKRIYKLAEHLGIGVEIK